MSPDLVLVNGNRMRPPIGPIGLDYIAGAVRRAGFSVDVADLCLADDPEKALRSAFAGASPRLVGVTLRNVDDCFWPSAAWFVDDLAATIASIRGLTEAPIVLGGVGFSIFSRQAMEHTGADFGIRGDGEEATVALLRELAGDRKLDRADGLLWRDGGRIVANRPAWPAEISVDTSRTAFDNAAYFRRGGQAGVETKRGCSRLCAYCADPIAKGPVVRTRRPAEVADEFEGLAAKGIDVLHLCDSEFNIPREHAWAVCEELVARSLGERVKWYSYLAVKPFDPELGALMRRAGCAGINFTGDSASDSMLEAFGHPHRRGGIADAVRICREQGIAVMIDLLLGGPGETPETVAGTIGFAKELDPDCVGAALGLRIYPGTAMERRVGAEGPLDANPAIRRRYEGPVDLFRPTFYISKALGERPGQLVRSFIASDRRFFEPALEVPGDHDRDEATQSYNYNDNSPLSAAIAGGARGAYWDILRKLR